MSPDYSNIGLLYTVLPRPILRAPILRDPPPQLRGYLARIFHPKIFRGPTEIRVI